MKQELKKKENQNEERDDRWIRMHELSTDWPQPDQLSVIGSLKFKPEPNTLDSPRFLPALPLMSSSLFTSF